VWDIELCEFVLSMNIHEYQAKEVLSGYGVRVPKGFPAFSVDEAIFAAKELQGLGNNVFVVKAQIHAGGRGKAGGVKIVKSISDVEQVAKQMLGSVLVTHQTGPDGQKVRRLYIEAGSNIKKSYYLSLILDRATSKIAIIYSSEGGVDIEDVAENHPEKIGKLYIDQSIGIQQFHARNIGFGLDIPGALLRDFCSLMVNLYDAFVKTEAMQIEINPLVLTMDNEIICLDAKLNFDDNAIYRHTDIEVLRDLDEEDPLETKASKQGLSYVKMNGTIGCMVNGAGLAMATMDIIKLSGKEPANFLDVGGGANKEKVAAAFSIILSDKNVKVILVNIFGGIMKCDIIADGIVAAAKEIKITVPLIVRLEGTNVDLGKKILTESGLNIIAAADLTDVARKIVEIG